MDAEKELIFKKTLYTGTKNIPFRDGTKVHFHFQTKSCYNEEKVIDDSRKLCNGKPLDMVLGKKFKLEVWEAILQKMALNEVAEFTVDKSLVVQYPFVSKTLRDLQKPKEDRKRSHCCAMTLQNEGMGYDDLNDLIKNPCDLKFTIEIVKVEQPEDYEKETWQLEEEEKVTLIPKLKEEGNKEFQKKNYVKAAELYAKAIGMLEQLMIKEKPYDTEWNDMERQKCPILLNFSQCKLFEGDYYAVIEHCSNVLKIDKNNVKAYFRRAKAHKGVWNVKEAREDFEKVFQLDKSLESVVRKELDELEKQIKEKNHKDKENLKKLFV